MECENTDGHGYSENDFRKDKRDAFQLFNSFRVFVKEALQLKTLRAYLASHESATLSISGNDNELVWPGNWIEERAEVIRLDLKVAGIPYSDDTGADFDFHALRCQFITGLAKADVSLQAAQSRCW